MTCSWESNYTFPAGSFDMPMVSMQYMYICQKSIWYPVYPPRLFLNFSVRSWKKPPDPWQCSPPVSSCAPHFWGPNSWEDLWPTGGTSTRVSLGSSSRREVQSLGVFFVTTKVLGIWWVFPKMVVPPKHPKMIIFSRKTNGPMVVGYHHFRIYKPWTDWVLVTFALF